MSKNNTIFLNSTPVSISMKKTNTPPICKGCGGSDFSWNGKRIICKNCGKTRIREMKVFTWIQATTKEEYDREWQRRNRERIREKYLKQHKRTKEWWEAHQLVRYDHVRLVEVIKGSGMTTPEIAQGTGLAWYIIMSDKARPSKRMQKIRIEKYEKFFWKKFIL